MYIGIYVSAIVLICVGAITFFIVKDQRNKKLAERLQKQANDETAVSLNGDERGESSAVEIGKAAKVEEKKDIQILPKNQMELEDFSLDFETDKKKNKPNFDLNPFSLDGGFSGNEKSEEEDDAIFDDPKDDNFLEEEDEDDSDIDKKFKEYEEFLKRNLDLDDDDFEDDDFLKDAKSVDEEDFGSNLPPMVDYRKGNVEGDDLRALQNFDYDSLRGKSQEEIDEIIKSLPPRAQEILISDILARRKFEEDE